MVHERLKGPLQQVRPLLRAAAQNHLDEIDDKADHNGRHGAAHECARRIFQIPRHVDAGQNPRDRGKVNGKNDPESDRRLRVGRAEVSLEQRRIKASQCAAQEGGDGQSQHSHDDVLDANRRTGTNQIDDEQKGRRA